jgi:hypothetical protein
VLVMLKYTCNTVREVVVWTELRYRKVHGRIVQKMTIKNRISLQKAKELLGQMNSYETDFDIHRTVHRDIFLS